MALRIVTETLTATYKRITRTAEETTLVHDGKKVVDIGTGRAVVSCPASYVLAVGTAKECDDEVKALGLTTAAAGEP
jgi:hypothetical protein